MEKQVTFSNSLVTKKFAATKKAAFPTALFSMLFKNYDLFFFFAALAALFSFRFKTGSFFAEFLEGDFSFAIALMY